MSLERAQQLIADSLLWDNHGCMPLRPDDLSFLPQLARYADSGFNVAGINVGFDAIPWENTLRMISTFRAWIRENEEHLLQVRSVDDVRLARESGRLGVFFDIEGGSALNGDLNLIESYYELGVRWMLIAYNRHNLLGGGCQEEDDPGLTDFGRQVIAEMERVGMITCCSHTGHHTAMQVIEYATNPVIFSHSNASAVWENKRNIGDELIKACAETGGVVGVNGIGTFLGENDTRSETFVRHVDHMVQLVGPKHVGIGLDYVFDVSEGANFLKKNPEFYPGEQKYAEDDGYRLVQPEQISEIVAGLLDLGYADSDLQDILGGNFLRVAATVWK